MIAEPGQRDSLTRFRDHEPLPAVSCPPAGPCAAGGYYTDAAGRTRGFVVTQAG